MLRFIATMVKLRAPGERPLTNMQCYVGYLALVEQLPMAEIAHRSCISRTAADAHLLELARRVGCEEAQALRRLVSLLLWDRAA